MLDERRAHERLRDGFVGDRPRPRGWVVLLALEALDATGNVLEATTPLAFTNASGSVTLASPDFTATQVTSVTIQVRFETDTDVFLSCTDAGVASNAFEYSLVDGTGTISDPVLVANTVQMCSGTNGGNNVVFMDEGSFEFDGGDYTVYISSCENTIDGNFAWDGKCTFQLNLGQANTVVCDASVASVVSCTPPA